MGTQCMASVIWVHSAWIWVRSAWHWCSPFVMESCGPAELWLVCGGEGRGVSEGRSESEGSE